MFITGRVFSYESEYLENKPKKPQQISSSLYYNCKHFPININKTGNLFPQVPQNRKEPCKRRKPVNHIKDSAFMQNILLIAQKFLIELYITRGHK